MGCNYLSLPLIPASCRTLLICGTGHGVLFLFLHRCSMGVVLVSGQEMVAFWVYVWPLIIIYDFLWVQGFACRCVEMKNLRIMWLHYMKLAYKYHGVIWHVVWFKICVTFLMLCKFHKCSVRRILKWALSGFSERFQIVYTVVICNI